MKSRLILSVLIAIAFSAESCDLSDRVGRLEKQVQELQAQQSKNQAAVDLDLQAKCSRDSKEWFKENYPPDKDTQLLTQQNHYNKKLTKCFVFVEYHYALGGSQSSWSNLMSLYDTYENGEYARFGENHSLTASPTFQSRDEVITCESQGQKCKTLDEFNSLVRPYMND